MKLDKKSINNESKLMLEEIGYLLRERLDIDSLDGNNAKTLNCLVSKVWLFVNNNAK